MGNDVFPCEPIIHLQVLKGIQLLFFLTFGWKEWIHVEGSRSSVDTRHWGGVLNKIVLVT